MKPPPTLRLTLGLAVAIARGDETAVRQGLDILGRDLIEHDFEGVQILRQLNINLTPEQRHWFGVRFGTGN